MYLFQQAQNCHGLDKQALVHGSYLHMLSGIRPYFLSSHRSITLSVLQCVGQQKAVRLNDSTVRVQAEAGAAGAREEGRVFLRIFWCVLTDVTGRQNRESAPKILLVRQLAQCFAGESINPLTPIDSWLFFFCKSHSV